MKKAFVTALIALATFSSIIAGPFSDCIKDQSWVWREDCGADCHNNPDVICIEDRW